MERVIVESPFKGDYAKNRAYLFMALRDCLQRGEAPFASHLFYTDLLDDRVACDRDKGIKAGLAWAEGCDKVAVYNDLGLSEGMKIGISNHLANGREVVYRSLEGWQNQT